MLLVARVDHRRVLLLGLAGLVPAALVTMLLVHQPSVGDRRLYPLLRGPLAFIGLVLALAAVVTWVTTPPRLNRPSLSGLAWAGVTVTLCIGPFLESSPRARLYALDLATGDVAWTSRRDVTAPRLVGDDLVVTDVDAGELVGLDPATGGERWRRAADTGQLPAEEDAGEVIFGDGGLWSADDPAWSVSLEGERVVDAVVVGDRVYAYVVTPGADSVDAGAIIEVDALDADVRWLQQLPGPVAAAPDDATIGAGGGAVVVAGGERIAGLDAETGDLLWSESVAALGKSRGYALPGAVQRVVVNDTLVFLSTTPDR